MILSISQISGFQRLGINSGRFFHDFQWIWLLKLLWSLQFASRWPRLGQIGDNFQPSWGNLGTPPSLILDALPCLGNIFVVWGPPDAFED